MIIERRKKLILSLLLFVGSLSACSSFGSYTELRSIFTTSLASIQPLTLDVGEQCPSQETSDTPYCGILGEYDLLSETYRNLSQHQEVGTVKLAFFTNGQKTCVDYLADEDCALASLDVDICNDASCRENNADIIVMQNDPNVDVVDVVERNPHAMFILPLDDYLSFGEEQSLQKDRILWISGKKSCDALPEHHRSSCVRVSEKQRIQYAHNREDASWVGIFASKVLSLWKSKIDNPYALKSILSFCRTASLTIDDTCFLDEEKKHLLLDLFKASPKNIILYAPPPETYSRHARSREENRFCITYVSWCEPASSPEEVIDTDVNRNEAIKGYTDMISAYSSRGGQEKAIRIGVFFSPDHIPTDEEKSILETATLNSHASHKKKSIIIDYIPCDIEPAIHVCKDESYQYDIVVLQQHAFLSDVTLGEREGSISADIILVSHDIADDITVNEDDAGAPFYDQEGRIVQLSLFCSESGKAYCFSKPLTGKDKNFRQLSQDSLDAFPEERSIMAGTLLGISIAQFDHFSPRSNLADILPPLSDCDWSFSCFFKDGKFSPIENDIPVLPYTFNVPLSNSPVFALENHCIHLLFSLCKGDSNDGYTVIAQEYYARSKINNTQLNHRVYISGLDNIDPLLFPKGIFCDASISECSDDIPIQNIRCSVDHCPHKANIFYVDANEGNEQVNNIDNNDSPVVIVVINAAEAQDLINGEHFQSLANKTYAGTVFTAKDEATCSILSAYPCFVTTDEVNVYGERVDGSFIFLSTVAYLSSVGGYTTEGENFVNEILYRCHDENKHLDLQKCITIEAANIFIPLYDDADSSPFYVENILRSSPSPIVSSADLFTINPDAFSCPSHSTMCDGLFQGQENISIPGFTLLDHYFRQRQDEITTNIKSLHSRPITFSIANPALKTPLMETLGSYACFESSNTTCSDTNTVFHVSDCVTHECSTSTSDILVYASSPDAPEPTPHWDIDKTFSLVISDAEVRGSLSLDNLLVAIAHNAECPHLGHCLEVPSVFAAYDENYLHLRSNHALESLTRTSILAKVSGYIFWLWPFMTTKSTVNLLLGCGEQQEDGRSPSLSLTCLAGEGSSLRASTISNAITSHEVDVLPTIYYPHPNSCAISLCSQVPLWIGETPLTHADTFLSSTLLGYDQFLAIYDKAYEQGFLQRQVKVAFVGNTSGLPDEISDLLVNLPNIIGEMFHKEQANAWLCSVTPDKQCGKHVPIVLESYDCSLSNGSCYDANELDVLVVYDEASLPEKLGENTLLIIGSIGYDNSLPSLSDYSSHPLLKSDLERIIFAFDAKQASVVYPPKEASCVSLLHLASSCVSLPSIVRRHPDIVAIDEETYVTSAAILGSIAAQMLSLFPALRPQLLKNVLTLCVSEERRFSLACLVDDQSIELPTVCIEETQDNCYDGHYSIALQPRNVPFYQDKEQADQCHALNSLCAGIKLTKDALPSNGIDGYSTLVYNMLNVESLRETRTSINIATLLPNDENGQKTLHKRQEEARISMMIISSIVAQEECVESIYAASVAELESSLCSGEYVVPKLVSCEASCEVDHSIRVLHAKHLERKDFDNLEKIFPRSLVITESDSSFYPLVPSHHPTIYVGSWKNTVDGLRTSKPCYAPLVCLLAPSRFYGFSNDYQRLLVHSEDASTEIIAGIASLLFTLFPDLSGKRMLDIIINCSNAASTKHKLYLSLNCYDSSSTAEPSASSNSSNNAKQLVLSQPSVGGLSLHNKTPGSLLWRSTFSSNGSKRESFVSKIMPWASVFSGYASLKEDIAYMQDGLGAYSGLDVTIPAFSFLIEGRLIGLLGVHNNAFPNRTQQQAVFIMEGAASLRISKKIATSFASTKVALQGACFSGATTLFASTLLLSAKPSCQISLGTHITF